MDVQDIRARSLTACAARSARRSSARTEVIDLMLTSLLAGGHDSLGGRAGHSQDADHTLLSPQVWLCNSGRINSRRI